MAALEPVIRTDALTKRYGDTVAVRSLDLEVRPGEVFGLLGPNGAGKTTTILMLLGLSEPSGGTARVLGLDPARQPLRVKRQVGYLPDNVGFYGALSGRQNLRYTCALNGIDGREAEARMDRWLARVGLEGAADDRVDTYSRGMRQRLGLADALVKGPRVVILDEPTTSIDPVGVREILGLVEGLSHDEGLTVLLSSHLLGQVQQVCDRIAIFVAGEVAAMGTVADLAARQESGPTVSIELGVHGPRAGVEAVLTSVPAVASVSHGADDREMWLVQGRAGVGDAVLRAMLDAGYSPWLLKDRGMDLDDIYRRYFETLPDPGAGVSEAAFAGVPS